MSGCVELTKAMLKDPINLHIQSEWLDFEAARRIADRKAHEMAPFPMLLAWFDKRKAEFSPKVE